MGSPAVPTVFSRRLDEALATCPRSAREIADDVGLSEQALSGYRKGRSTPNPEVLAKLSEQLDVTSDWLLGLSDSRQEVKPSSILRDDSATLAVAEYARDSAFRLRRALAELQLDPVREARFWVAYDEADLLRSQIDGADKSNG